ncbi:hypothetical protein ABQ415_15565 [Klebsiella oxytoca]|uniref:hypothetical protein n=1 Tax=Klebsiella oxytoca TaxID=571 RepID=UPI003AAC5EC4
MVSSAVFFVVSALLTAANNPGEVKKISEKSARPFNAEEGTFNGVIVVSRERTSPLR